jgi:hypothetical protein
MHSGMYALQESVRQMRGNAPAQIPGAKVSVCHGVGGVFAASETDHHVERAAVSGFEGAARLSSVVIEPQQHVISCRQILIDQWDLHQPALSSAPPSHPPQYDKNDDYNI